MKILLLIFPLLEISFLSECPCEMNASRQTQHESALYPVVPCRIAARSSTACTALRHCPMLRFAFSATGGAQLRIPVTRISVPMEFEPLKHTSKEKTMKLSSHRFSFGALSVEGVKKKLPAAVFLARVSLRDKCKPPGAA